MRHTRLTSALFSLALAGSAFAQGAPSGMHGEAHGAGGRMSHESMKSSPNAAGAEFDHQFIDTMIVHHESAIEMAKLAEDRARHDELKRMAKKVIDDQQKEIRQLQAWKKAWYPDKGDAVNMRMRGMAESMKDMRMDKLAAAKGDEFDALFIDMMTRHHRGALRMAEHARQKTRRPEIKKIAKEIIREQQTEITQMTRWKNEWKLGAK